MYKVYWTEDGKPQVEDFEDNELTTCLQFMEALRIQRRTGVRNTSFITMVAENPNSVGQAGVDETGPGYREQWNKDHRSSGPEAGVIYTHRKK
jgi:hypothetical protein